MKVEDFQRSLSANEPPPGLTEALVALWWDARGDWERAHSYAQEDEGPAGAWVHAYLHRKEGQQSNADYWYRRAGSEFRRPTFEAEWSALVEGLLTARSDTR